MKPLIGLFTRPSDDHLERVMLELERRHLSWIRFDTQDFPKMLCLAARLGKTRRSWQGDAQLNHTAFRLEDLHSIWYRRPTHTYSFPTGLSEEGYAFAQAEAQKGFGGLLSSLPARWVNHPDALRAAAYKPRQLEIARQVGLIVPKTLLTNHPQAALDFFDECAGAMIYKPLNQGVPRPKVGEPWRGAIYTTKLTRDALHTHASEIALTMHLFQEYIPKAFELRITIIGGQVFAAEIHSQQSERARIDFRKGYQDLTYQVHQLPAQIEQACLALNHRYGLLFSAMDMIVTPTGDYVFLEVNASGQWGWIEQQTGLPLTNCLVDLFLHEEGTHA